MGILEPRKFLEQAYQIFEENVLQKNMSLQVTLQLYALETVIIDDNDKVIIAIPGLGE